MYRSSVGTQESIGHHHSKCYWKSMTFTTVRYIVMLTVQLPNLTEFVVQFDYTIESKI